MLVPAVRASTAWLPTVLLVDVVVLIKKEIRHPSSQGGNESLSVTHAQKSRPSRFRDEIVIVSSALELPLIESRV